MKALIYILIGIFIFSTLLFFASVVTGMLGIISSDAAAWGGISFAGIGIFSYITVHYMILDEREQKHLEVEKLIALTPPD